MRKPKLREVLVVAPFLVWAGWDSFKDLQELEANGGSLWVGKTTKFLYDLGGKWGVLIGIWGLVAVYLYAVWTTYKRERDERDSAAPTQAPRRSPRTQPARTRGHTFQHTAAQSVPTAIPSPAPRPLVVPPPFVHTPIASEPTFLR